MNQFPPASPTRGTFSSSSASHTLRPRQKRLISGLDDLAEDNYSASALQSPSSTPSESPFFSSRDQSPIPRQHPSRSSSNNPYARRQHISNDLGNDLASSLSGLWGRSWTSLQGLASNVLSADVTTDPVKDNPQRIRKPPNSIRARPNALPSQWGPALPSDGTQPGGGTSKDRTAMVRAKKREELLRAKSGYTNLDRGPKRRTSDDFGRSSVPPGTSDDRDTLVYIHHVTSGDTLPGVCLKFGCSLQVVRQANRLWSNDGIQFRKTLVLPVDACTIKGRRVASPTDTQQPDLLSGDGVLEYPDRTPKAAQNPWNQQRANSDTTITQASQHANGSFTPPDSSKSTEDVPWKHDSWMLLTSFTTPTELVRLPRSELGFFPRARRKSFVYSDLETPGSSFDLQRPAIVVTEPPSASAQIIQTSSRHRRLSSTERFAQQIIGRSGGVGTLGGKGPSAPGPADDKLTQVLNKHIPGMILPSTAPLAPPEEEAYHSGASTPTGLHLEQMGGAIEGWVRKMAGSAARAMGPTGSMSPRALRPSGGRGQVRDVDLIELSDQYEIGEDEDEEEEMDGRADERGRRRGQGTASGWGQQNGLTVRERAGKDKGV